MRSHRRKLNPAERSYHLHEREMLAMVHTLPKLMHCVVGGRVPTYTDNVALRYLKG